MGSRVSPSWQQRLATGEVYWPTAGPGEGKQGNKGWHTSSPHPTPLHILQLILRDQELKTGQWGASSPPTVNARTGPSWPRIPHTGTLGSSE